MQSKLIHSRVVVVVVGGLVEAVVGVVADVTVEAIVEVVVEAVVDVVVGAVVGRVVDVVVVDVVVLVLVAAVVVVAVDAIVVAVLKLVVVREVVIVRPEELGIGVIYQPRVGPETEVKAARSEEIMGKELVALKYLTLEERFSLRITEQVWKIEKVHCSHFFFCAHPKKQLLFLQHSVINSVFSPKT